MSDNINVEEILKSISPNLAREYSKRPELKAAIKEIVTKVLKRATKKAKTKEDKSAWSGQVWDDGPLPVIVDKRSIINVGKEVEYE